MDEKEEQELIEKGLRYRPTIKEARTYIVDKDGNEIEQQKSSESGDLSPEEKRTRDTDTDTDKEE